ncbi:MAG: hypothetical protein F6K31_33205 [Symploca sp. SIO2G7]|nr:hypothetical protein [Symploca sp. SIO2G7]
MAAAMALTALLDWGLRCLSRFWQQSIALGLITGFTIITVGYPTLLNSFLNVVYVRSSQIVLYEYLQQQPKDIRIASLTREAENIPAFTGRSVLVSPGHSLAYHQGYYEQIRPRILDLITAQYTPDLAQLQTIINRYNIDFWLIDERSFNPDTLSRQWIRQFKPELAVALAWLQQQPPPALQQLQATCTDIRDQGKILISAQCLLKSNL